MPRVVTSRTGRMAGRHAAAYARSLRDPESFWAAAAEQVHWYKRWEKVLDDSNKPFYRWFVGGEVNYNALDHPPREHRECPSH
jgi:propionyl-CoA synthetase